MANEKDREIVFEIVEQIGRLKAFPNGWSKELNRVSWNGTDPKYDIRDWDENHEHMTRGATLRPDEMQKVVELLKDRTI